MASSSSCLFFANSFSFFLLRLIHLRVSSTSPSTSPRVVPLSFALSSRLFLTLQIAPNEHYALAARRYGLSWPGKVEAYAVDSQADVTHFAMRSWIDLKEGSI